jgi:hypothetical protein
MPDLKLFGKNFGDPFNRGAKTTESNNGPGDYSGSTTYKARGGPATFEDNKYQISQHSYPIDLMSPTAEYGGNYVVFYINAAIDSKLLQENPSLAVDDDTQAQLARDTGDLTALSSKYKTGAFGAVAAPTAVALGALALSGQATTTTTDLNGYTSTGISAATYKTLGVAAVGALALKSVASTFSAAKKRLTTAIALHTPNNMTTSYSVNYDEEDTDIYAMGLAAVGGSASIAEAIKKRGFSNVGADGTNAITAAGLAVGLKLPGMGGISRITGLAPNPRKEQLFKHVNFRTFTFDYQFYPRDAQEAENVLKIIYQFKYHMHPEFKDANNFLYIYPSEFDISYYNNGQENMNVNRHTSCVLTDMVVNYSPNGQFTAFANGMPTQINLTLTFKELATLTKEKIEDPYIFI